jgi:integrase
MRPSCRHLSFSSSVVNEAEARAFFLFLRQHPENALAIFLDRIGSLPLGKNGLIALGAVPQEEFKLESIRLQEKSLGGKRRKSDYAVYLPNVFIDLPSDSISAFIQAARNPQYLRETISALGYPLPRRFGFPTLGRWFEALLGGFPDQVLVRLYNFRGERANWGKSKTLQKPSTSKALSKRKSCLPETTRVVRLYGEAVNKVGTECPRLIFEFPSVYPRSMADSNGIKIIREMFNERKRTGRPRSHSSFRRYLRGSILILSQPAGEVITQVPEKQAWRWVKRAAQTLNIALPVRRTAGRKKSSYQAIQRMSQCEELAMRDMENDRTLEHYVARVILLTMVFSGCRISSFALMRLSDFTELLTNDSSHPPPQCELTIEYTKVKAVRKVRLPLHRLLPPAALLAIHRMINALSRTAGQPDSVFEFLTGKQWNHGTDLENARKPIWNALLRIFPWIPSHTHMFRHSFASWAPIAALLAYAPHARKHPLLVELLKDSWLLSEEQSKNWQFLLGRKGADILGCVSTLTGHTSPAELEKGYCCTWELQTLIRFLTLQSDLTDSR